MLHVTIFREVTRRGRLYSLAHPDMTLDVAGSEVLECEAYKAAEDISIFLYPYLASHVCVRTQRLYHKNMADQIFSKSELLEG